LRLGGFARKISFYEFVNIEKRKLKIDESRINSIKGFLDHDEGLTLYEFALKASRLGPCLEIGGYCGKSTIYLGLACRENNSILFSVDHHRGSEEQQPGEEYFDPELFDTKTFRMDTFSHFRQSIERAGLEGTVVPLVSRSEVAAQAWATPLSLVFIDGGHSYPAVHMDYTVWSSHILSGGYLLIHDIFPDPKKGGQAPYEVYKIAIGSGLFDVLPMVKTLGLLQRKYPSPGASKIK
jgi:predicted O-methyltransferase YrrM